MTPDSPKGPEKDSRVQCGSCRQHETVERLTAEVERLRERVHTAVDETQRRYAPYQSRCDQFDGWSKWARDKYERHGDRWGMQSEATRLIIQSLLQERDEWKQAAEAEAEALDQEQAERRAEISRLREQLAAQPTLPPNASYRIGYTVVRRLREAGVPLNLVQQNLVPQIVRDVLASWRASSFEAEAPQPAASVSESVPVVPQPEFLATVPPGHERNPRNDTVLLHDCKGRNCCYEQCSCGHIDDCHDNESGCTECDCCSKFTLRASAPSEASKEEDLDEGRPSGSERLEPADELHELDVLAYRAGLTRSLANDGKSFERIAAALKLAATVLVPGCGRLDWCDACNHHVLHGVRSDAAQAPRWRAGDTAIDQTNFVHRRFEQGWRTWPREKGVQYGDDLMELELGPMLRLDEVPAETDAYGHVPLLAAERARAAQAARSEAPEGSGASWIEKDRFADFREALSYARSHFSLACVAHSKVTREEAYWIYSTIKHGFDQLERNRAESLPRTEQEAGK